VIREKPDYAEAHYSLGKLLLERGSVAGAVEHLEGAAKLKPAKSYLHYELGRAYMKAGRRTDARREFELTRKLKAVEHPQEATERQME